MRCNKGWSHRLGFPQIRAKRFIRSSHFDAGAAQWASTAVARHDPPHVDARHCRTPPGRGESTGSKSIHEV
jgi:hypothetical protein